MPSAIMTLDTGMPNFTGKESTEQKVEALNNYVFMLLEHLKYILRNLGGENLNEGDVMEWITNHAAPIYSSVVNNVGGVDITNVFSEEGIADAVSAEFGDIAGLTVWRLRTDYMRARNYLSGSTADLNYIYIHDEVIEFRTASVKAGAPPVQLVRDGLPCWWTDAKRTAITTQKTKYPVTVYQYDELVKAKIEFQNVGGTWYPVFQFGAGDGSGNNIGKIVKDENGLRVLLTTTAGEEIGLKTYASGGAEAPGLNWFGTLREYNALTDKNPYTVYYIETGSEGSEDGDT